MSIHRIKIKYDMKYLTIIIASLMIFGQACTETKAKEDVKKTEDMEQVSPKAYTTFKVSDNVAMYKVTFQNQYKMDVAGHLFIPKSLDTNKKHSAIIVGHPMGAVKEQSANVYASNMAERGFITLSIDLSYWGESEGEPRNVVAPDMYSEDFSAAVDFLGTRPFVERNRIGVLGVCGSGSFVISAAKIDPRMKAIATVSMYDMGSASRNALNHSQTIEQRKKNQVEAAELLGINRNTLRKRIKELDVALPGMVGASSVSSRPLRSSRANGARPWSAHRAV